MVNYNNIGDFDLYHSEINPVKYEVDAGILCEIIRFWGRYKNVNYDWIDIEDSLDKNPFFEVFNKYMEAVESELERQSKLGNIATLEKLEIWLSKNYDSFNEWEDIKHIFEK